MYPNEKRVFFRLLNVLHTGSFILLFISPLVPLSFSYGVFSIYESDKACGKHNLTIL